MVFIPQGTFTMGPSDQDVPFANVSESKQVSIGAFYMDETEITNNEYRQFTSWVRDSLLRTEFKMWASNNKSLAHKSKNLSQSDQKQPNLDWDRNEVPKQLGDLMIEDDLDLMDEDGSIPTTWDKALDWKT